MAWPCITARENCSAIPHEDSPRQQPRSVSKGVEDRLGHLVGRPRSVDGAQRAFLPVHVSYWLSLGVIHLQATLDGLRIVVRAPCSPPSGKPLPHHLVGNIQTDSHIDVRPRGILGLGNGSGKAVEHIAPRSFRRAEHLVECGQDHRVRDQLPALGKRPPLIERAAVRPVVADQLAG